ncbi:thioester dehydrase [Parashewanella curva]|uniref:Thioester dehydrase n=1 Tax=Parashewanella curva TaxID=2338552 RepID=A0A3L8PYU5_9GAMM|nr:hotdog family protein [Parashewanella curva]RLV60534.1 thioester dehydrase [Parashewanella curva]
MIDFTTVDVQELLPHRRPMVLIDEIISYDQDHLISQIHVTENSPYFDESIMGVPNYVGIEYMAQTIAAFGGVEAKKQHCPIQIGFLLGTRKLTFAIPHFLLAKSYQTKVKRLYQEDSGLAVFDCKIFYQDQVVASANVNVFQPSDAETYLKTSIAGE